MQTLAYRCKNIILNPLKLIFKEIFNQSKEDGDKIG
jgi:hypothetical protein